MSNFCKPGESIIEAIDRLSKENGWYNFIEYIKTQKINTLIIYTEGPLELYRDDELILEIQVGKKYSQFANTESIINDEWSIKLFGHNNKNWLYVLSSTGLTPTPPSIVTTYEKGEKLKIMSSLTIKTSSF